MFVDTKIILAKFEKCSYYERRGILRSLKIDEPTFRLKQEYTRIELIELAKRLECPLTELLPKKKDIIDPILELSILSFFRILKIDVHKLDNSVKLVVKGEPIFITYDNYNRLLSNIKDKVVLEFKALAFDKLTESNKHTRNQLDIGLSNKVK